MTDLISMDRLPDLAMPFDPPADRRDPYPDFARLRREQPVVLGPESPGIRLGWVFRHEDVATLLTDHTRFSNDAARVYLGPALGEDLLVGKDPPEHPRYRRLVQPVFSPAAIAGWKAGLVTEVLNALLDDLAAKDAPDLVRDLALPLPLRVVAGILGLPDEDLEKFGAWTMDFITVAANPESALRSAQALRDYLDPIIEERMARPRGDVISRLAAETIDGDSLSHAQIQSFLLTLLPAGIETTYRAIGNLMFMLLSEPSLWKKLVADPSLAGAAVEESLRLEAPLQVVFRTVRHDTELGGVKIPAGMHLIPVLGSANRDETIHPNPDAFDLGRPRRSALTFGNGGHTCIGLHLAKAEMTTTLLALIDRFPNMRLDGRAIIEQDVHIRGLMVRSPANLPVRLS